MRLQDKVALITGSGGGIGKGIAVAFAKEGAKVVVNDINQDSAREVAALINKSGGIACFIAGNISIEADDANLIAKTVETYGCLDILVNNAAVEQPIKAIQDITEEEWDHVINVNLKGTFFMCKHAIKQMITQQRGNIINVASMSSLRGQPRHEVYCASKGGVLQMTRSLALGYRDINIRANAICPGLIRTQLGTFFVDAYKSMGMPIDEMIVAKQHRWGEVDEIANTALFLASDDSSFINGIALPVDNGSTAA